MVNKIRTTHVGSLPRTPELLEANNRFSAGDITREQFLEILQNSVDEVVRRQHELGLDIINEGEYGHITSGAVDLSQLDVIYIVRHRHFHEHVEVVVHERVSQHIDAGETGGCVHKPHKAILLLCIEQEPLAGYSADDVVIPLALREDSW